MPMRRAAIALAFATALVGCSFVAVVRPPSNSASSSGSECTQSLAMPLIDAAVTVLSGLLAVNLLAAAGNREGDTRGLRVGGYASAGVSAVFLTSAAYGAWQVSRCRQLSRSEASAAEEPQPLDGPAEGTHGGSCRSDGSCDDELLCDKPMNTCIPINPDGEEL